MSDIVVLTRDPRQYVH